MFFGEEGYEVVAVGDGAGALRELEAEGPPDVLLADAVMPGPDGYELCERVKRDARFGHVPVVLLVGTFEPFNEAEARRVGADTVLTKPFQSIRDLVSKVGSLLGGDSKHEEERPAREEAGGRADDSVDARAEAEARPVEGARREPSGAEAGGGEAAQGYVAAADSPFADLGADDELIEARPADAFGGGAADNAGARRRTDAHEHTAHDATPPRDAFAAQDAQASEDFPGARFGSRDYERAGANGRASAAHASSSSPYASQTSHAEENPMPAQPTFEARAASAAAADDTLLDLGQLEPRPGALAAAADEADDFILDLEDEPPAQAAAAADVFDADVLDESDAREEYARSDAPSAFAEASHGGQDAPVLEMPAPVSESPERFQESAVPLAESARSSSGDEYSFDAGGLHTSASEDSAQAGASTEFVMQDGPQGFASYVAPQGVGSAPRGFVEPEVVPAESPVPAVAEGEFTDGSVEGDRPKAPAAAEAPQSAAPQAEPSTAGYSVVEGHTRVEEPARADQLSREAIDAIARRVVEMMSDKVVREIAWEVVPELAEMLIRQKLEEEKNR
jgi:CheY-like chemotaxis protein